MSKSTLGRFDEALVRLDRACQAYAIRETFNADRRDAIELERQHALNALRNLGVDLIEEGISIGAIASI